MELNYDMIILLQHLLYLYCIHDHFVIRGTIIHIDACDLYLKLSSSYDNMCIMRIITH
jgi:hypothetical protein